MIKLLTLYAHLLATCTALGVIIATDVRLLGKVRSADLHIAPPNKYVERLVAAALVVLYVTGGTLIWLGLQERPDYLDNPKLIAKIMLVLLLTANAFVLHLYTFPRLARKKPVAKWDPSDRMSVALPVAMSNSLWMFCAFLGIARPWSYTMPMSQVLSVALMVFMVALGGILFVLNLSAAKSRSESELYEETDFLQHAS